MRKKGQIQLSFGMIFSVLIIVATLLVAGYIIYNFLKYKDCTQVAIYYKNLQNDIDSIYRGEGGQLVFNADLPASITSVCFGDSSSAGLSGSEEQQLFFKNRGFGKNAFVYPTLISCGVQTNFKLEHAAINKFFCVDAQERKVEFKLTGTPGSPVTVSP